MQTCRFSSKYFTYINIQPLQPLCKMSVFIILICRKAGPPPWSWGLGTFLGVGHSKMNILAPLTVTVSQTRLLKHIYLFKSVKQRRRPLPTGSLSKWLWQPNLDQVETSSRNSVQVSHIGSRAEVLELSSASLPGAFIGIWKGSALRGTQTTILIRDASITITAPPSESQQWFQGLLFNWWHALLRVNFPPSSGIWNKAASQNRWHLT